MSSDPHAAAADPYATGPHGSGRDDGAGPEWSTHEDVDRRPEVQVRTLTLAISGALSLVLLLVLVVVPLPYAIERPGPTVDTLGELGGHPLITVDGAETYDSTGQLRLTTVSVSGGPGHPVTAGQVLRGWVLGSEIVVPREAMFAPTDTREVIQERSQAQMLSSQTNASVAALIELGYEVPMTMTVSTIGADSGAAGVLEVDDVVTGLAVPGGDVVDVPTFGDLVGALADVPPGQTVRVRVERDGEELILDVVTSAPPEAPDGGPSQPGSLLGVGILPDPELPMEIMFDIDRIGGPSAGTMFALAIIDLLGEEDLTGGEVIAGTGTVDIAGRVGAIGGIRLKMIGARDADAEWFLAPAANCAETVGHVPDGLTVVRVETLTEAREAVEAIAAGEGQGLPGCEVAAS